MDRTNLRQVLDCGSLLALFQRWRAIRKRQKTAAVQNAVAPIPAPSKLIAFLLAALTTTLLHCCPASAHAQGGVPLWTNSLEGFAGYSAADIAVDSSGNILLAGNSSDGELLTVKYSSAGSTLWTNRYKVPGSSENNPNAIGVDSSGNVFVTVYFYYLNGINSGALLAYSSAGVLLWARVGAPGHEIIVGKIAVDNSGNVFVTGGFYDALGNAIPTTTKYSNAGVPLWTNYNGAAEHIALDNSGNVFVTGGSVTIKYSNSGAPLWTNRYDGTNHLGYSAADIAVDGSGNVFVTGSSRTDSIRGTAANDYVTLAYSNSGVPLWTNRYDGPANSGDAPAAIAVDRAGNVFVTGASVSDSGDYATIKYSNSGVPLWTNRYDGPANSSDSPAAIAVDGSGNVFVTGNSWNCQPGFPPNCGFIGHIDSDYATVAYSNAGVPLWTIRYDGPVNLDDGGSAIAVDSSGNVFVTGSSWNGVAYDWVTIKYSSSLPPPVQLAFQRLNNQLVLSWTNAGFTLQSAPVPTGTFTNIPGATTPYTNSLTGTQQFYRLVQ